MSEEEFYVTLDFQQHRPDLSLPYKLIGLDSAHPIAQVGHKLYRGTWATVVGTEMLLDERGQWIMNVQKRLIMQPVQVKRKTNGRQAPLKTRLIRLEDAQEGAIAPESVLEAQNETTQQQDSPDRASDRDSGMEID